MNKRIQVEWGEEAIDQRGVLGDISLGGVYIECRRPPKVGTLLHLHVLDHERDFYVEGIVARQKLVEPSLRRVHSEGMGIRFLSPDELVSRSIPKTQRRAEAGAVFVAQKADAEKLIKEQLAARMLLVPVQDPLPAQGTVVEFLVRLGWTDVEPFEGKGRLVQLLGMEASKQAVVEVHDVQVLLDWIRAQ